MEMSSQFLVLSSVTRAAAARNKFQTCMQMSKILHFIKHFYFKFHLMKKPFSDDNVIQIIIS